MRRSTFILVLISSSPASYGGMPSMDFNEIIALRLQDISFFVALGLVCALGMKWTWNTAFKEFPNLPRSLVSKRPWA